MQNILEPKNFSFEINIDISHFDRWKPDSWKEFKQPHIWLDRDLTTDTFDIYYEGSRIVPVIDVETFDDKHYSLTPNFLKDFYKNESTGGIHKVSGKLFGSPKYNNLKHMTIGYKSHLDIVNNKGMTWVLHFQDHRKDKFVIRGENKPINLQTIKRISFDNVCSTFPAMIASCMLLRNSGVDVKNRGWHLTQDQVRYFTKAAGYDVGWSGFVPRVEYDNITFTPDKISKDGVYRKIYNVKHSRTNSGFFMEGYTADMHYTLSLHGKYFNFDPENPGGWMTFHEDVYRDTIKMLDAKDTIGNIKLSGILVKNKASTIKPVYRKLIDDLNEDPKRGEIFIEDVFSYDYANQYTIKNTSEDSRIGYIIPYSFKGVMPTTLSLDVNSYFKNVNITGYFKRESPLLDKSEGDINIILVSKTYYNLKNLKLIKMLIYSKTFEEIVNKTMTLKAIGNLERRNYEKMEN